MITVVVLHVIAKENRAQAEFLIERNTNDSKRAEGFVSRRILFSVEDPLRCYSVTSWRSRKDLENFRTRPNRPVLEIEGAERRIYQQPPSGRQLLFTESSTEICTEED
jgi:heme-degrading monooxygenase HmoA